MELHQKRFKFDTTQIQNTKSQRNRARKAHYFEDGSSPFYK